MRGQSKSLLREGRVRVSFITEYLRYVGRRSVVVDHLFNVRLQGRGLAYAAGAPARGAPLAWGRSFGDVFFNNVLSVHGNYYLN